MQHCAIVGILGAPNAGKSTLLNQLAGRKRAIVTHKANTTIEPIRAIVNDGGTQLLLIDTPGILSSRKRDEAGDPKSLANALEDADVFLLMVDAARSGGEMRRGSLETSAFFQPLIKEAAEIRRGGSEGAKLCLVLNKIDLLAKESLLELTVLWNRHMNFDETFFISATQGDGIKDVLGYLAKQAPPGPWLYPDGVEDSEQERHLASEITREKLLLRLHQEIPYEASVAQECWERRKDGALHIEQVIYVRREQHRKIILGKNGSVIRDVSTSARFEMEEVFGCRVHLFLRVKLRERGGVKS
ncbi:MAG: GTPase Era [Hyphomicrobiales bacterium]|nr:GTPase Era [Hyphomicrobiales bacterium]